MSPPLFQVNDQETYLNAICDKLVHRHPHIYSDVEVETEEEVKSNWEKLKLKEGKESVLEGVPKSLPALVKAYRIQEKVKGIGFEWEKRQDVWAKVKEEMAELAEEVESGASTDRIEDEFGDVLFSLINYARFIKINPEDALSRTNSKFISRFTRMEKLMKLDNLNIEEAELQTMDIYWDKAKILERSENS